MAVVLGKPASFLSALGFVLAWAISGPFFHYSETWQIVVNTATTIVTFLMVFLLQNTQSRDSMAIHLKLNELLRAVSEARTELVTIERDSDERLHELHNEFAVLADEEQARLESTSSVSNGEPAPPA